MEWINWREVGPGNCLFGNSHYSCLLRVHARRCGCVQLHRILGWRESNQNGFRRSEEVVGLRTTRRQESSSKSLKGKLDRLLLQYGKKDLGDDPLLFPHQYSNPEDQELVAFISSALSYGNVLQIRRSLERVFQTLGPSPRQFVERFDPLRDAKLFDGFSHRFNRGEDIACLLFLLKQMLREKGSLEGFFCGERNSKNLSMFELLSNFISRVRALDPGPFYGGKFPACGEGVRFFFPSPADGSACKRLCMFLRWVVRKDELDLGLWKKISPAELMIPVDTHIARIANHLGLASTANASWRLAEEITSKLRKFDSQDPVKYDFALTRIGIVEGWPRKTPQTNASKALLRSKP